MIRSPPSRILPGPEDINYHLERVLMRLAARYQVYSSADSDDDTDFSSPAPSPGSSSGYESAGSWSGSKGKSSEQGQEDQYQDEDEDKEPDGESQSSLTGSCIIHRETQLHANDCTWRSLSLLQPPRFTPRVLMVIPDGRESWSADGEALTLSPGEPTRSRPLHSQVSSLRLLFETLSLNSQPSHNPVFDQKLSPVSRLGSENQRPIQSKSQLESELDINLRMGKNPTSQASGTQSKMPGPVKKPRAAQSDIAMEDAPAQASSTASNAESSDAREPVLSRGEKTRKSDSTAQKPVPARKPRKIQKTASGQATGEATGQANRQATRKATGQSTGQNTGQATRQATQATGQATRATSSARVPGASEQSTNAAADTQGTVATRRKAAPSTQSQANTRTANAAAPAVASNNNTSQPTTNNAATTATQAMTSSSLSPEKWTHMMNSSRAFHNHVQQMLAELDDEYDDEDEFGMRELRRRPAGSGCGTTIGG